LAAAAVTSRTQAHRAYLVDNLSATDRNYQLLVQQYEAALHNMGVAAAAVGQQAQGLVNQALQAQASFLGYMDVFTYSATAAFCIVPLTFLFRGTKVGGGAAAPAH
jgi:MFS transporter, DHA2 family, multidrug resistance protein